MSAFVVVYERTDTPVDSELFENVMDKLKHRGPDGRDQHVAESIALGHWHFWTTPEELGELQPLQIKEAPFRIVFDGRLDNRSELFSELSISSTEGQNISDAVLILQAYLRWDEQCFEHFIGEYALVIFNESRRELICARDALGDRSLFYAFRGTQLIIASEPWAIATSIQSEIHLSEMATACFFALRAPLDGQTLFQDIFELLPAHAMVVNSTSQQLWRYWQPDLSAKLKGRSDDEYAEQFRFLLDQSIRARLRSIPPVGVLMSGGMDSTSIACLAAKIIAPQPLTTISYVFDELTECDERDRINSVAEQWGVRSFQIPCDDAWPLKDWENWLQNPNFPEPNLYQLLQERMYREGRAQGMRVMLTGAFGDHLYASSVDWLADLILDGYFLEAAKEFDLNIHKMGWSATLRSNFLRRVARKLIDRIPGGRRFHRSRMNAPRWLTNYAIDRMSNAESGSSSETGPYETLVGLIASMNSSGMIFNANKNGLELRQPYRDRRLVEYVMKLPGYQLYHRGLSKYILRNALRNILPEEVLNQSTKTTLLGLFNRGIEREEAVFRSCLKDPHRSWQKLVRSDMLEHSWNTLTSSAQDGSEALFPFLCIAYKKWYDYVGFEFAGDYNG